MKGNQGQGMPDSILKQKASNTMYGRPRSDMHTINERQTQYDDASGYTNDFKENNNDLNASNFDATLSMSLKDPNRPPRDVPGLAEFLEKQYEKKLGVRTENPQDLLQFWRNYVSVFHIREAKEKAAKRGLDADYLPQAGGLSLLGGGSPKKY